MNKIYPLDEVVKLQTNNKSSRRSFCIKCLVVAGISAFVILCFIGLVLGSILIYPLFIKYPDDYNFNLTNSSYNTTDNTAKNVFIASCNKATIRNFVCSKP